MVRAMRHIVLASLLVACGKDAWDKSLDKLEEHKDRTCACTDAACAREEASKINDYLDKRLYRLSKEPTSEAQSRRNNRLLAEIHDCQQPLYSADAARQGAGQLQEMKQLADELCACSDWPCAKAVEVKVDALMDDMLTSNLAKNPGEQYKSELKTYEQKLGSCLTNLKAR